ncbi:beta-ketoacyl-[acyl-carrier-protein] synthase family protein [Nocardia terpenica]|uniref:Beta-ketoacyl synthase n=1 Tax=Nocardia terpenica TaxID=455432 RepID=A0A161Z6N1_9NOCA|nr:beta-ketoacyl-[acyl-carrier-protein] synthase family protein [Nocardia terpenica]KZM75674.1 beta-ketoacyl synthase [Nocardia terpenica]MBF6064829.1 beta-ketoacyl-[acyl-carrier-protein] synthase family protein [Nocardia terpenica]MBF6107344.1 beta-ketoacyl-[acyl-carrier-protein] synthase family protein [Nocardia terpenica]MBF6115101.1 beta-ketoacyl-[acyl-carrier-protein] synthase family protein [Nocardia terpenica]MBF6122207.1 beta-ketoacyl-[acyl-carrier-protein] synthase family protein [Noc
MTQHSVPRAVVTGIGLVTPIGRAIDEFFSVLCEPGSGLVRPPRGHIGEGLVDAAGIAPVIDPFSVVPRTDAGVADRFSVMAVAAADDALADAGVKIGEDVDPNRVAVIVSTGAGGMETFEQQALVQHARGTGAVSPYLFAGFLPNMAAARIAIKYGIRGPSATISTACAASAHAIAEALRLIRGGDADVVVCGGTEASLGPTGLAGFRNARALSSGWDDPTQASRPFDRHRNGFVLGEGGGVLVVERADLTDARGGSGYADLIGWGATTDAYHLVMPRPDGSSAAQSMRVALRNADVSTDRVGYLNAHGTGTRIGDLSEVKAIREVFGDDQPKVSSTKGVTGHLLGGAGAIEAAATVLAMSRGQLPPTKNLDDPDPKCELDHVRGTALATKVDVALSNSFAFGGHNVSLVFAQPSTRRRRGSGEADGEA